MKQLLYILASASVPAFSLAMQQLSSGHPVSWLQIAVVAAFNAAVTTRALYDRIGSIEDRGK